MEKVIEVLNSLITINNHRIEGYKTASEATEELDLKTLFRKFNLTSQRCKQELFMEVNKLGGKVAVGTKTSGKFFREWMDVKAALTEKDRKAILSSCEYGEDMALNTYEKALKNYLEYLNAKQQTLITAQKLLLKADYTYVKHCSMHLQMHKLEHQHDTSISSIDFSRDSLGNRTNTLRHRLQYASEKALGNMIF